MAKYRCSVCGYIYDEGEEGRPFAQLEEGWRCPRCTAPKALFERVEDPPPPAGEEEGEAPGSPDADPHLAEIDRLARTGVSETAAMATTLPLPRWEDILFLGGQLARLPLLDEEPVATETVIGRHAQKPMVLSMPLYISHMSFGALSREAKVALAKGATAAGTAACSGEGGILPEEQAAAATYLYEYPPNGYSATDENLRRAAAIEIKIGQGTKPGMGGHLPGEKVTTEIAALRGKPVGEDIHSPSRFPGIESPGDLRALVSQLRDRSQGRPIGVKIAAGHLEEDLAFLAQSGADFITIDGRGGATGASPRFLRDSTSLPTIYALHRARRFLDSHRLEMELVITGGLRTGPDFAKALAMGADAVAIASSALMALGCRQYRICGSGRCPMGIATQDPVLRKRLDGEEGARRVERFLRGSCEEIKTFCRICGHRRVDELSVDDLCTLDEEIARHAGIRHA
ncbi:MULTISPECIES: glutamate synthase-related protein [Eubacteriales]|uniref:FMN-binding glutamate synthase family protein n=1 Tax=Bittarella massiliensis (ex Durand et al. 2017) TaxID=1720313 RepID=A0AAQ1RVW0_9FIRM|nr:MULTISPECIES: glutamate synthase-related protein [Eubacteriales]MZL70683.1 FMN-binding glutamate synthase family protein [Bittarella massiliensis (ex Durand et al. 2017)]MZL81319.1 FMN-binding glutamate synthase family protein [Bittarella massiliensis (ex Durand et al. 2017)]SHG05673.1 Rubredoxin [Bittarella massiliensis (ex Durand et al. 2017)]